MFTVFSGYTVHPAGVSEAAINQATAHIFVTEEQGCSKSAAQSRVRTHNTPLARAHTRNSMTVTVKSTVVSLQMIQKQKSQHLHFRAVYFKAFLRWGNRSLSLHVLAVSSLQN